MVTYVVYLILFIINKDREIYNSNTGLLVYFTGNIFCQANPVYIYIFSSSNKKKQLPGQMSMVHVTGVARLPGVIYF